MARPPRLHVAILACNALAFTKRCLRSLVRHGAMNHAITILDNGSDDGTREWLAPIKLANMRTIRSDRNLGVPAGRNVLLSDILERADGNDLVVFLDNDVEVRASWSRPFLTLFARYRSVGIAGISGYNLVVSPDRRTLQPPPRNGIAGVDVVSGYCLWVRARVAAALGPFDQNLGLFWHEDDDYCLRAIALGYRVVCVPNAPITHHEHKSGAATAAAAIEGSLVNQRYLAGKWRDLGLIDAAGHVVRPAGRGAV